MKKIVFLVTVFFGLKCQSQQPDSSIQRLDSVSYLKDTLAGQSADSMMRDSIKVVHKKSDIPINQYLKIIAENRFLSNGKTPVESFQQLHHPRDQNLFFYAIASFFFFLGILRISFGKYFNNLFSVFFNTSLRQSQLTDQLLQDKLPSMLFNIFFVLTGGAYIFLLMVESEKISFDEYEYLYYGMVVVAAVYLIKFLILQLIGWLSGLRRDTELYIFIVFLINKILGILLLPIIAILAFGDDALKEITVHISFFLIGFMIILRYLRAYSIIQQTLKISKFHFLLYIITVELLPIFLIYHIAWNILSKSL